MTINPSKIQWHCHRGMLELDKMLLPFFENNFKDLSAEKQQDFEELLVAEDVEIYSWLMATTQAPAENLQAIVSDIRQFHKSNK